MKLTFQKIILSFFAIAVSVSAAVIGMYMVFLANMVFGYRLLFAAIFMFNPILTIFLIVFMFKKPEPKEEKDKKKRKDKEEEYAVDTSYSTPEPPAYIPPSDPVPPAAPQSSFAEPAESSFTQTSPTDSSAGYDLPGSETFTGYSETTNASDVTAAESSASSVKSKLKFWAKSDADKEGN